MRRRSQLQIKRQLWRITPDAPLGRWVDPEVARIDEQPQPEERFGSGMRQSSFELAIGLEVKDATDIVPGELLDELFRQTTRRDAS